MVQPGQPGHRQPCFGHRRTCRRGSWGRNDPGAGRWRHHPCGQAFPRPRGHHGRLSHLPSHRGPKPGRAGSPGTDPLPPGHGGGHPRPDGGPPPSPPAGPGPARLPLPCGGGAFAGGAGLSGGHFYRRPCHGSHLPTLYPCPGGPPGHPGGLRHGAGMSWHRQGPLGL